MAAVGLATREGVGVYVQSARGTDVSVSRTALDSEWDAFVDSAPGGHHLQTSLWAQVKAQHGWRPVRLHAQCEGRPLGGAQLLVRNTRLGTIAYCARGPLLRDSGDRETLLALLDGLALLARSAKILYIKLQLPAGYEELELTLRERGFVASDMGVAPSTTARVDLRRSVEEIVASMRSSARSNIRKAMRKGVVVRAAGVAGLPAFGDLLAATGERQQFPPYAIEYYAEILRQFGDHAELFIAECEGETVAGAMIIGYGDTVIYKMGGWAGDRNGLHPNELMHLTAMEWAKDRDYGYYDFDGIEPAAALAVLAGEEIPKTGFGAFGVTRFKLGLGGEPAIFPRTYDRSFNRLLAIPVRLAAPRLLRLQSLAYRLQGRATARG